MAGTNESLKDHWQEQRLFLSRVLWSVAVILLLTMALIARLVQLQIVDYERFSDLSQGNRVRIEPLAPTRGLILDRNGLVLAENLPTWQLVATPEQIEDLDGTLAELEGIGLLNPAARPELIELVRSHRGFERVTLVNLDDDQAARFAVRRHRYRGIDIQEGLVRHYPFGEVAAHAIGYVGSISTDDLETIDRPNYAASSSIGKTGVERAYEALLHGKVGYRQQVVNARGRILMDPATQASVEGDGILAGLETRWPVPGQNIVVGLDMKLQLAAYEAMQNARGAVVALDPRNGDVLALVSTPSFDPNRFSEGLSRADFVALNSDPHRPLFNRALTGRYPPGSTIKPFLGLAGLYHESVAAHDHTFCPGYFSLPGQTHRYRDWRPRGHGNMDLHNAIVQSCDVYYYQLAVKLGIDRMETFLKRFGFGAVTGIDIAGERAGVVPSRDWKRRAFSRREDQVWFPGETVIAGIGQGFTLVTPIQLANAVAAMSTRGDRYETRLLIATENGIDPEVSPRLPRLLPPLLDVDDEYWQEIHDAMTGVTTEPAGSGFRVMSGTPYTVAGKTGTAQVYTIAQDEEYDEDELDEALRDHGLFVAFAPVEDPQVVVAVVVENGGGSSAAVPVARRILDSYFEENEYVAQQR
ncbi:MAG: penicillin-binding protein 2 [Gammaproteobacteria bacterium]|jgi:penicillin-binding protein 2